MRFSVPAPHASVVPGARTGCQRVRGGAAVGQVADRERGDRCCAGSTAGGNNTLPDWELGQQRDLKHPVGLKELWAMPLPAGLCLTSQKSSVGNVGRWISAAAGSGLPEHNAYRRDVVCCWPLLCLLSPF